MDCTSARFPRGVARRWVIAVVMALAGGFLGQGAGLAATDFADAPLLELPQTGAIPRERTTLRAVAKKYRAEYQAESLIIYGWGASSTWSPPVQAVFVDELRQLDELAWDRRMATKTTPVSILTVEAASETERKSIYHAVQQAAKANQRIPTFIDETGACTEGLAAALGDSSLFLPALVRVNSESFAITGRRGDDPARADTWLALLDQPLAPVEGEPVTLPKGAETSWYRRHIARVVTAHVLDAGANASFQPKMPVTDVEFLSGLAKISPERAANALREADPKHPAALSRERALTAVVRFLHGDSPADAVARLAPPNGETTQGSQEDAGRVWRQALAALPGATSVTPALRPYLSLALADGLLCNEPSLHARWPLTREYAAWLLDRARGVATTGNTGVIVDCTDLLMEPDRRFGQGGVLVAGAESPRKLYPAEALACRLPTPAAGYPAVLYADYRAVTKTDSPEATWLKARVGERPLTVRPLRVMGRGSLGRDVVISAEDAARLVALNQEAGVLDNWRVAFLLGVGAQLVQSVARPLPRRGGVSVCFNTALDPATLGPETVRLVRHDTSAATPAKITQGSGLPQEVHVDPDSPLDPGVAYDLVLSTALRSVQGEPLSGHAEDSLPEGVARLWTLSTENLVTARLSFSHAPDGSKIYVNDELCATLPSQTAVELTRAPGPVEVRAELPDGTTHRTTCQIDRDGDYAIRFTQPVPTRLVLSLAPAEVALGQPATLSVRAFGAEGPLRDHAPITVTLNPTGCEVSPARTFTLTSGEATLSLMPSRPGKATVVVQTSDLSIVIAPPMLELHCKYVPAASPPVWSPVEVWHLPRAGEAADISISPRLRRWLAREANREIRVVAHDGTALHPVAQLPGRDEFAVDAEGFLHFHRSNAGSVLDVSYQYRNGRCGVLVKPPPGAEPIATHLREAVGRFLDDLGYVCVPAEDVVATLGGMDALETPTRPSVVADTVALLALDDLLVVTLTPRDRQEWRLSFLICSDREQGLRWASYPSGDQAIRFRADPARPAPALTDQLRRQVEQALSGWYAEAGLSPSADQSRPRR